MDSDGDFVVTWSSYGQDGDVYGIYGQRYSAAGVAQGGEFKVNSTTSDYQQFSTVAMDSDGDFVVTWTSNGQDGSESGVYAQRYGITPNVIVDTVAPTAEIIDINPDVRDTSVSTIAFQFSEAVVNFEVSDLVLTRDGSPVALNGATLTPSSGDRSWTLTLPDSLTAVEGRYQLTLAQGSLTDLAGNALELGTSDGWLTGRTATALPAINFQGGKRIRGTNRSETIQGLFRNDVLLGLGGNDTLTTESKRAKLSGVDRLYGGSGNDTLSAGQGNDLLDGGSGRDRLLGGNGNDQLLGGSGNDMLVGDAGKDTFVFKGLNEGKDVIAGFNAAEDLIDLRSIMSRTEYGGDNAFARFRQFVQLQQVGANTEVRVDADGSGVGQTFTTLAMLQNTALNAVSARNFVIA
jgi:Ca2+-binding RTX toxin-like protein